MIIPVAALAALMLPLLFGGDLRHLGTVPLRHVGWIAAALAVQILIVEILTGPVAVLRAVHIATYVALAAFVLVNRRIPGLALIGIGAGLNGLAITVNDGVLPARAGALRAAGAGVDAGGFVNSGTVAHPHLALLGDIFAVPASLPLSNVFSIGDIVIILGIGMASWRILGTRWSRPWRPLRPRHARQGAPMHDHEEVVPAHGERASSRSAKSIAIRWASSGSTSGSSSATWT